MVFDRDARLKLLLVDDVEARRTRYVEYFLFVGYRVIESRMGAEALIRGRASEPDIIVVDVSEPETGVWETVRLLKEDMKTRAAFLVALGEPGFEKRAARVGVDMFCGNSLPPPELAERIVQACGPAFKEIRAQRRKRASDAPASAGATGG